MPPVNEPVPGAVKRIMSVGNQYGYRCPNCHKGTELLITASAEVLLTSTGTDIDKETIPVWNDTSYADCLICGWEGTRANDVQLPDDFKFDA